MIRLSLRVLSLALVALLKALIKHSNGKDLLMKSLLLLLLFFLFFYFFYRGITPVAPIFLFWSCFSRNITNKRFSIDLENSKHLE